MMKARDVDEKAAVALESLAENIQKELETMQTRLFEKAKAFRAEHSHTHINSMDQSKQHLAESKFKTAKFLAGFLQAGAVTMLVRKA
nr:hypothetical protein [Terribacillus saccharophilus]